MFILDIAKWAQRHKTGVGRFMVIVGIVCLIAALVDTFAIAGGYINTSIAGNIILLIFGGILVIARGCHLLKQQKREREAGIWTRGQ